MKWKKLGRIFDPTEFNDGIQREWMNAYAQCPTAIVHENFVRVYFSCRPEVEKDGQYTSNTAFVDLDRKNLFHIIRVSKDPVMPLGELGTFDEFSIYPTCFIRDGEKTLLYYAGWTRCKSTPYTVSIGLASSEDGAKFERIFKGPILTNSPTDPFELSGPKVRRFNGKWFMYYLAGEGWRKIDGKAESIYKIRLAISEDGINWEKDISNGNIIPTVLPEEECQAGPDVIYIDGKYHMYFSYRYAHNFKNRERGYKIGYAKSIDGINWERNDSEGGICLSESGWDSEMNHYPHVFYMDGNYYMLYNGNEFGKRGIGLAILEN